MAALDARGLRLGRLAVVAQSALKAPVAQAVFLQHKQPHLAGDGGLHVSLFAFGAELALRGLQTHHALEPGDGLVLQLHAGVIGLVLEGGADGTVFDLVVRIVGHARAQAQGREACERVAQLATYVKTFAAQIHHGRIAMVVIFMVVAIVFARMGAAVQMIAVGVAAFKAVVVPRQAVLGRLARVGRAQVAALAHPRQPHAARVGAVEAARHLAGGLALRRPALAHAVVARVARHALHMHRQVASTAGQRESTRPLTGAGVGTQLGAAFVPFLRNGRGHLAIEHIDHAAHGAVAIHQGRGAPQHFDLRGEHGLGHHRVVGADGGGIVQLGTVAEHAHTRAVHAANDGAAGPGAKVAAGDAGLAAQRLAQRGLATAHQFIAFEHGHGRGHVARAQLQAAGRDGDGRQAGFGGRGCLGLGQRAAPCSNQSNGQGHGAQGKAAGCQCGMNHEEPWKSKKSDANRAATAVRGARRATAHAGTDPPALRR